MIFLIYPKPFSLALSKTTKTTNEPTTVGAVGLLGQSRAPN